MSSALKVPEALQFLQKEYKRFDSERGLWELEKSEYQVKRKNIFVTQWIEQNGNIGSRQKES